MTLQDFESLIQRHVDAAIEYCTSTTINLATYVKQENAVFDTKGELLDKIQDLISNQK
jgi:hypothetical protein